MLSEENEALAEKAAAKLQSEVKELRLLVKSIPPDMLKELQAAQKDKRAGSAERNGEGIRETATKVP